MSNAITNPRNNMKFPLAEEMFRSSWLSIKIALIVKLLNFVFETSCFIKNNVQKLPVSLFATISCIHYFVNYHREGGQLFKFILKNIMHYLFKCCTVPKNELKHTSQILSFISSRSIITEFKNIGKFLIYLRNFHRKNVALKEMFPFLFLMHSFYYSSIFPK